MNGTPSRRRCEGPPRVLGAWLALPLAVLAPLACSSAPSAAPQPDAADESAAVRRGDFRRELLLTGELRAVRSIEIKAPQTSLFQMRIQFMAEEGTMVEPGEPLLDFDNSGLAEQVQELESKILDAETQIVSKRNELASSLKDLEIELAEREYDHDLAQLEAAVDPEVLSRKEYGERQLAWQSAAERLEQTRQAIELTRRRGAAELEVLEIARDKLEKDRFIARQGVDRLAVRAPAPGLVVYERRPGTTLRFQEGDSCWPGQGVMRLPDLSEMQVEFSVNEVDAPLLQTGMPVAMRLDSFPDREIGGEIVHVPSMAVKRDDESKISVFKIVASLDETWVGEMKPGMSALGRIVVDERHDVALVKRDAVEFDGERYLLRLPGADGSEARFESIAPLARNEYDYVVSEEDYARIARNVPVAEAES